ncbi:hypothetical protein HGM15179_011314 [Zosterops borbonicus]|uniref:Uncharacterized protein n=1 Tax=Zosterops borbonicus TaxID=364589 RepID=A0A8K1GC99_9PASS|nr:hypothetical protein HGM15179_011314 [Zosterops borbonicus]
MDAEGAGRYLRNGEQEVPDDWRKANVTSIFQKGNKEEPGNYRPVSLTIIPGKVVEQITLKIITMHVEEIRNFDANEKLAPQKYDDRSENQTEKPNVPKAEKSGETRNWRGFSPLASVPDIIGSSGGSYRISGRKSARCEGYPDKSGSNR